MGTLANSENALCVPHLVVLNSVSNLSPVVLKHLFNSSFSDTCNSYILALMIYSFVYKYMCFRCIL